MLNNVYKVFNVYTGEIYIHTRFKALAVLFTMFNGNKGTDWAKREDIYFENSEALQTAVNYWYSKNDIAYASKLIQELTTRPEFTKAINKKRKTFQRKLKRETARKLRIETARKLKLENAKKAKVQTNA